MAIKILIKRKVSEANAPGLDFLLRKLRALALDQPGYLSGETYQRIDKGGANLVISTWQSIDDWRSWLANEERISVQNEIDALLGAKTEYEAYEAV